MDTAQLFWLAPAASLLALVFSYYLYHTLTSSNDSSSNKQEYKDLDDYTVEATNSYLLSQYKGSSLFLIIAFAFLSFLAFVLEILSPWTPIAFMTGGFFSALSCYLGMKVAIKACLKTAEATNSSLNTALKTSYKSGTIIGFLVVAFGLIDISIWWKILNYVKDNPVFFKDSIFAIESYRQIVGIMLTSGIGACLQALFVKVSSGLFSNATELAVELVEQTESNIQESGIKNPAFITNNIGNFVSSINGFCADLYESFCGSILVAIVLGVAAFNSKELLSLQTNSILFPLIIAGIGIFLSIIGTFFIKTKEEATPKELMESISFCGNISSFFTAVISIGVVYILMPNNLELFGSVATGIMVSVIIGWSTIYYTSQDYQPAENIAKQSSEDSSSVITEGIATSMFSTAIPTVAITIGILLSFGFANGFNNPSMGFYGIAIAAVAMLSTLALNIATNAYGSIAVNTDSYVKKTETSPDILKRANILGTNGNIAISIGKGFAIGSTILTAFVFICSYFEEVRLILERIAKFSGKPLSNSIFPTPDKSVLITDATIKDFVSNYNISLMNPIVIIGIFIGAMIVFVLGTILLKAVRNSAQNIVSEVKKQLKEISGLVKGETKADYDTCIKVANSSVQKEIIVPIVIITLIPTLVSLILGVSGVVGLLIGVLVCCFIFTIITSTFGSALNSAKKYIESGQLGGKDSDNYKFTTIANRVGIPFKDGLSTSVSIFAKTMSMVSIVVVGVAVSYSPSIQYIIGLNPTELANRKTYLKQNGFEDTEDLDKSGSDYHSSVYEDPLLGTEDIILPTDDDVLRVTTSSEKSDKESNSQVQEKTETKPTTQTTAPKSETSSGFSSGFDGGGFDSVDTTTSDKKEKSKSETSGGFDSGFGGGFDSFDTPADTGKKEESKSETSGGFDSGFGGGFDSFDEPTKTDKKEESKSETSGGFDSGFGGGFDSFDTPADTGKKEEPKAESKVETPKTDNSGFSGGFDSFDTPADTGKKEEPKAEPKVETPKTDNSGFSGGFDTFDTPSDTGKKEEPKAEPKVETPKSDNSGFGGGFDSFDAPATPEKSESKPSEPAKVEEPSKPEGSNAVIETKSEEEKPSEPAKVEEPSKPEESNVVIETKSEESKPSEPAKVEEPSKPEERNAVTEPNTEEEKTSEPTKVEEPSKPEESNAVTEPNTEEETPSEPAKVEESSKPEESNAVTETKAEEKDSESTKADNSNKVVDKIVDKVKEEVSDKLEENLNKATETIKDKVEGKKNAFESGFGGF